MKSKNYIKSCLIISGLFLGGASLVSSGYSMDDASNAEIDNSYHPLARAINSGDVELTRKILRLLNNLDVVKFHNRYKRKPGTIDVAGQVAGNDDYVSLEWNAISLNNGLIYAAARKCDYMDRSEI